MLKKFLPENYILKDGFINKSKVFEAPLIGLFFSALWCPPCNGFNSILIDFYKKVNADKKILEIIFCSVDEDISDYNQYLKIVPFPAIDFSDPKLEDLSTAFEIETIPVFIIFDKYGKLIELNGRIALQGKDKKSPEETIKNWMEKIQKE